MTIDRDEEGRDQGTFIYTHKNVRVSKLNNYKTLAYAVTYLKMVSTAQNYVQRGQQKVYGIQFEILLQIILSEKTSSPYTKPPSTHPFLLAIIYSYSDNIITATQYLICKTVQYCVKQ